MTYRPTDRLRRASFACTDLASSSWSTRRGTTCRIYADLGFGSICSLYLALLHHFKKGSCLAAAPGRKPLFFKASRTSLLLSPLPDTRSTQMTVTARSVQRPPDWTHGRSVAALALRPSRPTGSLAAALSPGLKDVSSRSPRFAAASWELGGARDPLPHRSPASARSPPDLNGGHQAGPAAVSSQRSTRRKELRLRTLRAANRPPIRKDRPIP